MRASESPVYFALKSSSLSKGREKSSQYLPHIGVKLNSLSCSGAQHPLNVYDKSPGNNSIYFSVLYIYSRWL